MYYTDVDTQFLFSMCLCVLSVFVIKYVLRIFKMQDGPHRYKYG